LKELVRKEVWIESLLLKNFMGDTPIHLAAKKGNIKILKFFLKHSPKSFLNIKNDLG
jgi:ankyrin repeat protein